MSLPRYSVFFFCSTYTLKIPSHVESSSLSLYRDLSFSFVSFPVYGILSGPLRDTTGVPPSFVNVMLLVFSKVLYYHKWNLPFFTNWHFFFSFHLVLFIPVPLLGTETKTYVSQLFCTKQAKPTIFVFRWNKKDIDGYVWVRHLNEEKWGTHFSPCLWYRTGQYELSLLFCYHRKKFCRLGHIIVSRVESKFIFKGGGVGVDSNPGESFVGLEPRTSTLP